MKVGIALVVGLSCSARVADANEVSAPRPIAPTELRVETFKVSPGGEVHAPRAMWVALVALSARGPNKRCSIPPVKLVDL